MTDLNSYEESLAIDLAKAEARIEDLIAENKRLGQQCEGLMQAGMNNGQALIIAEAKLAKAVEALQYANRMVRLDLLHMTDWDHKDFSQAVVDTGKRIATVLAELEGK